MYPTFTPVDVDNTVTIGEIVGPTATPTATATTVSTATPTSTSEATILPTATPTEIPQTIPTPFPYTPRRYMQNTLSIYGYGPPNSDVSLVGFGVSERTTTDSVGLFIFSPIYSYSYIYPELCIQAKDDQNRVTSMSCIPALSKDNRIPLVVGPVYLSPTVSIDENWRVLGDNTFLDGKTAPNTEVNVYIAKSYFIPTIQTKSDKDGNFSISLPTSDAFKYKIFVASRFGDNLSAKSNTLTFVVTSKEQSFINWLISWILNHKLLTIIILEVLVLTILVMKLLKSTTKGKKRHTERDYLKYVTSKLNLDK